MICDPQVYEKVECKHQDLNHFNCRREASCLVLTYGVTAKTRGLWGQIIHLRIILGQLLNVCACVRVCVSVCWGGGSHL